MAIDTAASGPGLRNAGVRSLDHLVSGRISQPERIPGADRVRSDVPGSKISHRYNSIFAWAAVSVASAAGGAAITIAVTGGGF